MQLIEMLCRGCGARIRGRTDKEWCSDACRKRVARQGEAIPEVEIVDSPPPAEPTTIESPATIETNRRTSPDGTLIFENAICAKHGLPYVKTYVRNVDGWIGQCDECRDAERFESRAREALSHRADEIRAKVRSLLPDYETQVLEQAETETQAWIARCLEDVKPQILADVRGRLWEQLQSQIENEELAKIVAELKTGKGA